MVEVHGHVREATSIDPAAYGEAFADVYDQWYADVSDVDATVALVAELAGPGPGAVLELGIGTGRIALPLRRRGVEVQGVDASPAMVARLRAKPGGDGIPVLVADFSAALPTGPFAVVLAAFNTFLNLPSEAAQRRCLELAHRSLVDGGALVVEAIVPDPAPPPSGVTVRRAGDDAVVLSVFLRRPSSSRVSGQLISFEPGGAVRARPWSVLPTGPKRLDELAADAGFAFDRRTYDDARTAHVTVYRKSGGTVRSVERA